MKGRNELRLATVITCVVLLSFASGCIGTPSVTTTSYYNSKVGTTSTATADPTAVTAIDIFSGNTRGCFAYGGAQPPAPPIGSGWVGLGSSPGVGQCNFSGYAPGSWNFDFFSGQCAVVGAPLGQPYDFQGFLTTDSGGKVRYTVCTLPADAAPTAGSHFAITGSLPSTVTVGSAGLTTTYGMPQLVVFNASMSLVTTVTATSVAPDGSSGTFPFPTSLGQGTYMFAVKNIAASGQFKIVDATYYSIGGNPALSSAFGVDAGNVTSSNRACVHTPYGDQCSTTTTTSASPALTQYNSNLLYYGTPSSNVTIPVGVRPVAVKLYGTYTTIYNYNFNGGYGTITTTGPSSAVVVNSGSNSVSVISFANNTTTNVAVGTQPMAVTLNSGATTAYVANYGSGTLSEVNLSTKSVSRTATVGTALLGVAVDPSGSYVWVGGTNNLYKVSLSTFAVVATFPVSGSVTSLAASTQQNELVYTLVQNCCTTNSTYAAKELLLSNLSTPGTYAQATASPFAPYTMNGTLPTAAALPQATVVSAQFGNGMAASSTPTGFVVYDVVSHKQLMAGTTPTPVRGIASDPLNTTVFLTVPESNEYITVPLPHL